MSLNDVREEFLARVSCASRYIEAVSSLSRDGRHEAAAKTAKGLFFVHLYSIYEYTLTAGFREILLGINNRQIEILNIKDGLLPLLLNSEFDSARNCSIDKTWATRLKIIYRLKAKEPAEFQTNLFPKDGSSFRPSQLDLIWEMLGMPASNLPTKQYDGYITSIVERRNEIAHGRETPDSVGGRFSLDDLTKMCSVLEKTCSHILTSFQSLTEGDSSFTK